MFWSYSDYGQPARPPLFNSSAELRNFVVGVWFFAISNALSLEYGPLALGGFLIYVKILPLNKEYGPLACFGVPIQ